MPNDETVPHLPRKEVSKSQNLFAILLTLVFLGVVIGGGIYLRKHSSQGASGTVTQTGTGAATSGTVVQKVNDLTVTFQMRGGLRMAQNEIPIEFRRGGQLVDVGTVKFSLDMNMPGMTMHDAATVNPAGLPGQSRTTIN